jgi:hypothetical protein
MKKSAGYTPKKKVTGKRVLQGRIPEPLATEANNFRLELNWSNQDLVLALVEKFVAEMKRKRA